MEKDKRLIVLPALLTAHFVVFQSEDQILRMAEGTMKIS